MLNKIPLVLILILSVVLSVVLSGCTNTTHYMQDDIKEIKELQDKLIKSKEVKDISFVYTPRIIDIKVDVEDNLAEIKVKKIFFQLKNLMTSEAVLNQMGMLYDKNGNGYPTIDISINPDYHFSASNIQCPPGKTENEVTKYKYWNSGTRTTVMERYITATGVTEE